MRHQHTFIINTQARGVGRRMYAGYRCQSCRKLFWIGHAAGVFDE
jgi:uncharacterized protein with PIN domain